jgi:hypothetical protein
MQAALAVASLVAALVAGVRVDAAEPRSMTPQPAGGGIVRVTQPSSVGSPHVRLSLGFDSAPLSTCATDSCGEALALEPHDGYLEWDLPALRRLPGAFTLRVGSFWSILGSEWDGYLGENSSRGLFLHRFALPTTHTGAVVEHQASDRLSLTGGVVRGGDPLRGGGIGLVGKATYWVNDLVALRSSALWDPSPSESIGSARLVSSVAAALYPTPYTTVLIGHDRGHEASSGTAAGNEWDSFAALLSRAIDSRGTASIHGQWFRAPAGVRAGSSRSHLEIGGGADYLVTRNVYTRLTLTRALGASRALPDAGTDVRWQISYLFD